MPTTTMPTTMTITTMPTTKMTTTLITTTKITTKTTTKTAMTIIIIIIVTLQMYQPKLTPIACLSIVNMDIYTTSEILGELMGMMKMGFQGSGVSYFI